jgi:hypothetical protein
MWCGMWCMLFKGIEHAYSTFPLVMERWKKCKELKLVSTPTNQNVQLHNQVDYEFVDFDTKFPYK